MKPKVQLFGPVHLVGKKGDQYCVDFTDADGTLQLGNYKASRKQAVVAFKKWLIKLNKEFKEFEAMKKKEGL